MSFTPVNGLYLADCTRTGLHLKFSVMLSLLVQPYFTASLY